MTFCQLYGHTFTASINHPWVYCLHCHTLRRGGGNQMTFDPTQNRIQTRNLTDAELAALKAAKHGWQCQSGEIGGKPCWQDMPGDPSWHRGNVYRAKPAPAPTITCNGVEVPAPEREALPYGTTYWAPDLLTDDMCMEAKWLGDRNDRLWLSRGLVHRSSAAAIVHAQAMIKGAV